MRFVLMVLATLASVVTERDAAAQPSHDACSSAVVIPSVPYTQTRSMNGATGSFDDPTFECQFGDYSGDQPSVWYRYTAPQAMSLQVDTFGSTFDTTVAVHEGACGLFTDVLACNTNDNDVDVITDQSRTFATLGAGQTVYIQVLDENGDGGMLTVNVKPTPVVQVSRLTAEGHVPSITAVPGGGFMVVWRSDDPDGDDQHVFGRTLTAAGLPAGPRFTVSESPMEDYPHPAVAAGGGNVVAVWDEGSDVLARRFDASGAALGGQFTVAADNVGYYPAVAADPLGNFLVAWMNGDDGSGSGVAAQAYDAFGVPQGGPVQVNTYTTDDQGRPSVSADGAGNFVVAWNSRGQDGDGYGVFAQRFDASGLPLGSEIPVSDVGDGDQRFPSVSSHAGGSFLVAWWDEECFFCVDTRGFDAAGAPVGPSVRIDDDRTGFPSNRPLATSVDGAGTFTVAWSDDYRIVSRQVDGTGAPVGALFEVSPFRSGYLYSPGVASAPGGEFVVVWEWSPYGSHYDVMSRLVNPAVDVGDPCPPEPRDGCRQPVIAGKSQLVLKNRFNDGSDSVTWRWARGEATALADFGNPLADGTYRLCVYDDFALGTWLSAAVPEGGPCGTKPCWKAKGAKGFSYTNGPATADGITSIKLVAGADGEASITVKGKGMNLRGPKLPFGQPPVRVQLIAGNDVCWETELDDEDIDANTANDFKAVGP